MTKERFEELKCLGQRYFCDIECDLDEALVHIRDYSEARRTAEWNEICVAIGLIWEQYVE